MWAMACKICCVRNQAKCIPACIDHKTSDGTDCLVVSMSRRSLEGP